MQWQLVVRGVVYRGRPLSAEAVRVAYHDLTRTEPAEHDAILSRLLRRSFPLQWRFLWSGDPVRQLLASPIKQRLLADFLRVAPDQDAPVRELDDWDRLEAMQRGESEPGPEVTLDTVCRVTEGAMGAGWYYCPDRWPTWDGYAPLDVVWRAWKTLQMMRAFDRLSMVRAIGISKAGDKAPGLYDADVMEALGA